MQHKGAHSLKDRRNILIFGVLLHLFVGIACQDCFRFYRPDTFQIWRIPKGSGLCNLNSYDGCPNNAVALISNASNGTFAFYKCTSFEDGASDMNKSYATGPEQAILVNFGTGQSSSLKPLIFKKYKTLTETSMMYKADIATHKSNFGGGTSKISILETDLVQENTSTFRVFQVLTVLVFIIVTGFAIYKHEHTNSLGAGFSTSYACLVTALDWWEMHLEIMVLTIVGCVIVGGLLGFAVHLLKLWNTKVSFFLSIIVNVACLIGMVFIPADPVGRFMMVLLGLLILSTVLYYACSVSWNSEVEMKHLHWLRLAEASVFGITMGTICIYSMNYSISLTLRRYLPQYKTYSNNTGVFELMGRVVLSSFAICIGGGIFTLIASRITRALATRNALNLDSTLGSAYMIHASPQYL